jgi:phosphoglycerate dehydrogenase-like enzyme
MFKRVFNIAPGASVVNELFNFGRPRGVPTAITYIPAMQRAIIWVGQRFTGAARQALEDATREHDLRWDSRGSASTLAASTGDPAASSAHIVFGQPTVEDLMRSTSLRWLALSTAGYTRYDRADLRRHLASIGAVTTNASGVYAVPCAQHALALLLSSTRAVAVSVADQQQARSWPQSGIRAGSCLLDHRTPVLLVGYGAIARELAGLLRPFGCPVIAFRRAPRGDEACPTLPIDWLDQHLPTAKAVINILPLSDSTKGFFDGSRLARMRPDAIFVNIGRGDTVDQPALIDALNAGRLGSAMLDVTSPEPLPPDHPLWSARNCYITPHTAGGSDDEFMRQVEHFIANLRRFERGEPLEDRILG